VEREARLRGRTTLDKNKVIAVQRSKESACEYV
jgi:hypothetical protein